MPIFTFSCCLLLFCCSCLPFFPFFPQSAPYSDLVSSYHSNLVASCSSGTNCSSCHFIDVNSQSNIKMPYCLLKADPSAWNFMFILRFCNLNEAKVVSLCHCSIYPFIFPFTSLGTKTLIAKFPLIWCQILVQVTVNFFQFQTCFQTIRRQVYHYLSIFDDCNLVHGCCSHNYYGYYNFRCNLHCTLASFLLAVCMTQCETVKFTQAKVMAGSIIFGYHLQHYCLAYQMYVFANFYLKSMKLGNETLDLDNQKNLLESENYEQVQFVLCALCGMIVFLFVLLSTSSQQIDMQKFILVYNLLFKQTIIKRQTGIQFKQQQENSRDQNRIMILQNAQLNSAIGKGGLAAGALGGTSNNLALGTSPSLSGGYQALYHNRIPMDIKYIDYDRNVRHIGGAEMLHVQIFGYGSKNNITKYKIQIGSEYDPFLGLSFECDAGKYSYLKAQQGLHTEFNQFGTVLIKCFNKIQEQCCCKTDIAVKGKLSASLLVSSDGKAKLVLTQSSQYKNIEIMSLDMLPESEQNTQQKVSYKYGELSKKVQQAEQRLAKIQQIIKQKNPTLLTQIFKTTSNQAQGIMKLNVSGI